MPDNNGVQYTNPPQSRVEAILAATIDNTPYDDPPESRNEDLLLLLKAAIENGALVGPAVIANPTETGEETELTGLQVGTTKYIIGGLKFDTMPSTEILLALPLNLIFYVQGFYNKTDGHGGYYYVTSTWTRGGLRLRGTDPERFLVAINDKGKPDNYIDVCRYGIREYSTGAINFNTITPQNTYAEANSEIWNKIYNPAYGANYVFPAGRFFFKTPININSGQTGIKGAGVPQGIRTASYTNDGYSTGSTTLYFPFLTNSQKAVNISFGNIENVAICGNLNTYSFHIDRTKTITAPNEVVEEIIGKDSEQNDIICTGLYKSQMGFIQNVAVCGFYYGIVCETANTYILNTYARACHYGLKVGGDIKCVGIYAWDVHTALVIEGSLTSAVSVRVDSCVNAVRIIRGTAITLVDVDGDYCTSYLIRIGDNNGYQNIIKCEFLGIHGRCCTLKAYDSTHETAPDVRNFADTTGYGLIRVSNGNGFYENHIVVNRAGADNPFDEASDYRTPSILFTFGDATTVHGLRFEVNYGKTFTKESVLKAIQTKSDMTARVDTQNGTYFLENTTVKKVLTDADIEG